MGAMSGPGWCKYPGTNLQPPLVQGSTGDVLRERETWRLQVEKNSEFVYIFL